jgi:hypothetical protein
VVSLGDGEPAWEVARWGTDALRFSPVQGWGLRPSLYALRGDGRRLLYKGERESHRFTVLDGGHFEYDVILKKEPASNKIALRLEGWEGFDFFRQPDGFGPEELRGSCAVYRRGEFVNTERLSFGTGKLCHIHRPKVIDARGREVWGDVRIAGGVMTLAIPEGWLGEAAYPVIVDPVVGTDTVGAYVSAPYMNAMDEDCYQEALADEPGLTRAEFMDGSHIGVEFYSSMALNQCKTVERVQGNFSAFVYAERSFTNWQGVPSGTDKLLPFLYDDAGNKPNRCLSGSPGVVDGRVSGASPKGWRQGSFTVGNEVASGKNVWFGYYGEGVVTRFDYGARYFQFDCGLNHLQYEQDGYGSLDEMIGDTELVNLHDMEIAAHLNPGCEEYNVFPGCRFDYKASMYFEARSGSAYTRTLTQGATFSAHLKKAHGIAKQISHAVAPADLFSRRHTATRFVAMATGFFDGMGHRNDWGRAVEDAAGIAGGNKHGAGYVRALRAVSENEAGTNNRAGYFRKQGETMSVVDSFFRHLTVFVRIVTPGFVRDYLISRFLKSKEQIVLKSRIVREIEIESRV